jgi:hypothetical protein
MMGVVAVELFENFQSIKRPLNVWVICLWQSLLALRMAGYLFLSRFFLEGVDGLMLSFE